MFLPVGMEEIVQCSVLRCPGARLQAYAGPSPRDHLPIGCTLLSAKHMIGPSEVQERTCWDRDRMINAMLMGSRASGVSC
eukprot:1549360-Pyramimonas_sp.AAC.1